MVRWLPHFSPRFGKASGSGGTWFGWVRPRGGGRCHTGGAPRGHGWVSLSSSPRGGAGSARSFEPVLAILLFSCTLALHARQVDVKLRLDYLWAAQARHALLLPGGWGVAGVGSWLDTSRLWRPRRLA